MNEQEFLSRLQTFGLALVPALFGIICHEVAHGWTAGKLGDPTARQLGRITLNPLRHIDPVGFGVFAFTALFTPFVIGWARPVPIQPRYFRHPRQGMVLVSLAGPVSNFFVALLCACIVKLVINLDEAGVGGLVLWSVYNSAAMGVMINCALAWFNLMPIPPLDGGHILAGLLPESLASAYERLARFGMLFVILLVAAGFFGKILIPLMRWSGDFLYTLVGL